MTEQNEQQDRQPEDPRDDPVVAEIRQTRRRLWDEAGGDSRRYVEQMRARLAKLRLDEPPADKARRSA